jgi:MFS family permease
MLSDKRDRRTVLIFCCIGAGISAYACSLTASGDASLLFYLCAFLFWGFATPTYALAASHTNDQLRRDQIVAVSGALILLNGAGAAFGPFLLSTLMKLTGNHNFFVIFAVTYALMTIYIIYRTRRRPVVATGTTTFINVSDANTPASPGLIDGREP